VASLVTRTIRDRSELVAFFNQRAVSHAEAHGDASTIPEEMSVPIDCEKAGANSAR
jgi:hypothetical protein